jgi:hypothetical protein
MSEPEPPKVRRRIRFSRGQFVGAIFAAFGIVLLILAFDAQTSIDEIGDTNEPDLQTRVSGLEDKRDAYVVTAIGALFMGFFALAMLGEPSSPAILPQGQMVSSARMNADVLAGLSITGNAAYLPAKHGISWEKILVSESKKDITPPAALSDDLVLTPGKDGSSPGIIVEPLGLALLGSVEKETGTSLAGVGIESAEGALQILKHGFGMMRDFHFKERDGKTILRVEYSGLLDACRTVRKEKPDTCRQISCFGCSCLLTGAARATGKMVAVESVDNGPDTVVFTLVMKDW